METQELPGFEAIVPHVTKVLEQFKDGSYYITLGGDKANDVELHKDIIIKKNLQVLVFEKHPNRHFQQTPQTDTTVEEYILKMIKLIESFGINKNNIHVFAGWADGDICKIGFHTHRFVQKQKKELWKESDIFFCLDTCNIATIYDLPRSMYYLAGSRFSENVVVLTNTQPSRHPGYATASNFVSLCYTGSVKYDEAIEHVELVSVPYKERGAYKRERRLDLWCRKGSRWDDRVPTEITDPTS